MGAAYADAIEAASPQAKQSACSGGDDAGVLEDFGHGVVGYMDSYTGGLTQEVRQLIGNDHVDYCSPYYAAGSAGGDVPGLLPGPGTALRVGAKVGLARGVVNAASKESARLWPRTAKEMDDFLGFPGKRIPDHPMTPGRSKVEWRPNSQTKITYEQHPYDGGPDFHRKPHWHLDLPGVEHRRYLPGDLIPGY